MPNGPRINLLLALVLTCNQVYGAEAFFIHTDLDGSVAMETDIEGNIVYERGYEPYGLPIGPIEDAPGFTGHVHDIGSGLIYMQQRYYDPEVGRFLSIDPMAVDATTAWNFNRYNYAANNPYRYTDPDGRAVCAIAPPAPFCYYVAVEVATYAAGVIATIWGAKEASDALNQRNESTEGGGDQPTDGNTNPYDGPVGEPIIVVDGDGNAIPVGAGEQITGSPDGEYQQVRDADGNQTGTRMDKGGHRGRADPNAHGPHGHRPGTTDATGNPHLPLKEPKPKPPEVRREKYRR